MIKFFRNSVGSLLMLLAVITAPLIASCAPIQKPLPEIVYVDRLVPVYAPCEPKLSPKKYELPIKEVDLSTIKPDSKEDIWPLTVALVASVKQLLAENGEKDVALDQCRGRVAPSQ